MGSAAPPKKRIRKRKARFPLPSGADATAHPPVPYIITGQKVESTKLEFVRQLRREMTPEETLLWSRLRGNKLRGLHFRRQQLVHGFIADFYCHAAGVVVEVDGGIHLAQTEYDAARDLAFATLGLFVLRFRNDEVSAGMSAVLERISTACMNRLSEQLS